MRINSFKNLVQDSFLTQRVLEPTRGENVLDIVLSSQKEFVDKVKIYEPLGCRYQPDICYHKSRRRTESNNTVQEKCFTKKDIRT